MRVALACLLVPAVALAEPVPEEPAQIHAWPESTRPERRSYAVPLVEAVLMNLSLNAGAQLVGYPWAEISPGSIRRNLTNPWVWDEDAFSINHFAHPYGGAWPFLAARSTGHGFWVATAYAVGASLMWELTMENEPPSLNDQLTTSIGGALLGESLHRIGRALRHGNPGVLRRAAATLVDPVGTFNRTVWGTAWRDRLPPSYYAHVGVGYERFEHFADRGAAASDLDALHIDLVLQHGLPGDPDFVPRQPLDHFDVRAAVDLARERVVGTLDIRGLLVGRRLPRGFWGLYGTYDYSNPERVRVSAIGVGPGIAYERGVAGGYLRATGVATLVPWGAAGGSMESEDIRDYQRGPGLGQIVELEAGRHGIGGLRLTSRAWQIDGSLVGDGREHVMSHTLAGHLALAANHAIGVEGTVSMRDPRLLPDDMVFRDRALEIRAFYALTSGAY
jgi:hypothetical protein